MRQEVKSALRVHRNSFGYRGVVWEPRKGKFRAVIFPNGGRGKPKRIGYFGKAEDAALAYDEAAREIYGEDARLNFPRANEKISIKSRYDDGICPYGHPYIVYGYKRPDGNGYNCRQCNNVANREYRSRIALGIKQPEAAT